MWWDVPSAEDQVNRASRSENERTLRAIQMRILEAVCVRSGRLGKIHTVLVGIPKPNHPGKPIPNTDPPAGFEEMDTLTTVNLVYELK